MSGETAPVAKQLTFYVMHCIDGDECAIAYCNTVDQAGGELRAAAARDPHADLSIWSSIGGLIALWDRRAKTLTMVPQRAATAKSVPS